MSARWREAQPLLADLGDDDRLSPLSRSRTLNILAELLLVIRDDKTGAAAAARRAEALAPEDWRVAYTRGRLQEADNTPEAMAAARASYEKAAEAAPDVGLPRVQLGQMLLRQDQVAAAESQFAAAASCASGPDDGYLALIALFGRPDLFPSRNHEIAFLVDCVRMVQFSRGPAYEAMLSAARAFGANGSDREELAWLQTAISYVPEEIGAYQDRGFLRLDKHHFDDARTDFTRVVAMAPGAPDGYWGMLNLSEATKDSICVLRSAARCLQRAPEWQFAIQERLEKIARALYDTHHEPRLAKIYYRFLRRRLGADYEPTYRNLNGNLLYYGRHFWAAAKEYQRAEQASPSVARYPANLAIALEAAINAIDKTGARVDADVSARVRNEETEQELTAALLKAVEGAGRALALDPSSTEFQELHARLSRAHGFVMLHGAAARRLVPDAVRLRVLVHPDLTPLVTDGASLAPAFIELINQLRVDVAKDANFTLCAVIVREMEAREELRGAWAIEIAGERMAQDYFDPAADRSSLLEEIIGRIRQLLPRLLCLDESRQIALKRKDSSDCYNA